MGMDQKILFAPDKKLTWASLSQLLVARNCPLTVRMIDGELAFPDETPPDEWRELRVATASGMITLRRESDGITLVIWGNADEKLRLECDAIAHALRDLASG